MSQSVTEGSISLDDARVETSSRRDFSDKPIRRVRFTENGQVMRIKLISEEVIMRKRHSNPIDKRYYRCLSHQGVCPACLAASQKINNIKKYSETFGTNVLVYDTNPDGSIKEPLNAEVHFWAFGSDKFVALRSIKNEWGDLTKKDLIVTCSESQFQKLSITPGAKCYYEEGGDRFKMECDNKIKSDSYPIDKFLCKEITLTQMMETFQIPESVVPASVIAQMSDQTRAQDVAAQPAAQASQAQAPAFSAPKTNPEEFASAESAVDESNFTSLDDVGNLL